MNKKVEEIAFLTGVDGKHSNKCSLLFCNPLMMYLLVARILIIVLEYSQGLEELWLELDDAEGFAGAIIVIAVHPLAPELCTSAWLEYVNSAIKEVRDAVFERDIEMANVFVAGSIECSNLEIYFH